MVLLLITTWNNTKAIYQDRRSRYILPMTPNIPRNYHVLEWPFHFQTPATCALQFIKSSGDASLDISVADMINISDKNLYIARPRIAGSSHSRCGRANLVEAWCHLGEILSSQSSQLWFHLSGFVWICLECHCLSSLPGPLGQQHWFAHKV